MYQKKRLPLPKRPPGANHDWSWTGAGDWLRRTTDYREQSTTHNWTGHVWSCPPAVPAGTPLAVLLTLIYWGKQLWMWPAEPPGFMDIMHIIHQSSREHAPRVPLLLPGSQIASNYRWFNSIISTIQLIITSHFPNSPCAVETVNTFQTKFGGTETWEFRHSSTHN